MEPGESLVTAQTETEDLVFCDFFYISSAHLLELWWCLKQYCIVLCDALFTDVHTRVLSETSNSCVCMCIFVQYIPACSRVVRQNKIISLGM